MVTDRLLHAHVNRTGGFLLRGVLLTIPGLRVLDSSLHPNVDRMLYLCQENRLEPPPIVAFIRNPWEWYVSMWCWVTAALPGYRLSFRSYLEVIREASSPDPNITTLSDHYYRFIQAHRATRIGRFETLREDITAILLDYLPDLVTREQIQELMDAEPRHHPSVDYFTRVPMEPYRVYYTPDTQEWVARWDAGLIAQYGYTFG